MTIWISTIGAPRGHRVRFAESRTGARYIQVLECECGWSINYGTDKPKGEAIAAHSRHVDLVRAGAWPDPATQESLDAIKRARANVPAGLTAISELLELARVPHPAELDDDGADLVQPSDVPHAAETDS